MRSTEPNEGSNGGSDERVSYMARYLVGNVSSRMHPCGPESASSMDKRVSARLSLRVSVCTDRHRRRFSLRCCKKIVRRVKGEDIRDENKPHPDVFSDVQLHSQVLVPFPQ